jgi:hypothetical protein
MKKNEYDKQLNKIADSLDIERDRIRFLFNSLVIGHFCQNLNIKLKGASSIQLRFGFNDSRRTKDLDFSIKGNYNNFINKLNISLKNKWMGFTGNAKITRYISNKKFIQMRVKLFVENENWASVDIDLSNDLFDEIESEYVYSRETIKLWNAFFKNEINKFPIVELEFQIAQKINAITESHGKCRMRDFYDLWKLTNANARNYKKTKRYIDLDIKVNRQNVKKPNIEKILNSLDDNSLFHLNKIFVDNTGIPVNIKYLSNNLQFLIDKVYNTTEL